MTIEIFEPGTLEQLAIARAQSALVCGALQPIATEYEFVAERGCQFVVRVATNLARKAKAKQEQVKEQRNPFLPYDERLFVADVSETHVCLLNKYNVVDRHILLITRDYEDQTDPLTVADFAALWRSLQEIDGLGFYNGGPAAGSSQPHKHLQLVPLPLAPEGVPILLEEHLLGKTETLLPFAAAIKPLPWDTSRSPQAAAVDLLAYYRDLRQELQLAAGDAFNLLSTRRWLAVVPRVRDRYQGIPLNSLGFAGALFVRDRETLQTLKAIGPLTVLAGVGRQRTS